jgi:beta-lactamase regulating signal transducer with metallopeptidase domain
MTFLWMLVASMVGLAGAVAAVALERAGRALGRSTRWPWVVALLFSTIWPTWLLARAVASPTSATVAPTYAILPPVIVTAGRSALTDIASHLPAFDSRISLVLLGAWLFATTGLLVRLCLGLWFIRRERRAWTRHDAGGVPVLIAPATGPAVVGVRKPAIVLPQWLLTLDPALRRLVVQHEREHVEAGDAALRLLGALLTALMPWNLALWIQANRLALAIEVDCDARVLAGESGHERYGLLLLAIAQRQSTAMFAPALSEGPSHLERRIAAMGHPLPKRPAVVAGGCLIAAGIALAVACSAPTPSAPAGAVATKANASATSAQVDTRLADAARAGAYVDYQVDPLGGQCPRSPCRPAARYPHNPTPLYPDSLQEAHVPGTVMVQFVVDTTGRVDMTTFKVLTSDNGLFTESVRAILPRQRFYPAEVGGRPVKELVQEPYVFAFRK